MPLKYRTHPGPVTSKYDGDLHFITHAQLVALYGPDPRGCAEAKNAHLDLIDPIEEIKALVGRTR